MAKTVKIPLKEIAEKAADKELSGYKVGVKPTIQYEGGDGIKISFSENSQLTSLSFTSAFNGAIPNITNMSYMFYQCDSLTSLDLSSFDTSKVTSMSDMFYQCDSLTSLDLSSFDTGNVTSMSGMFYQCDSLTSLRFPSNKSFNISSTGLAHDGLVVLLNDLKSVTTTRTLTMGSSKLALLSDAEKKIATDKGWTLA